MLTQLSSANKLPLDCITKQKTKLKQTPFCFDCVWRQVGRHYLVFYKIDLPLRPGHRNVNNVNESTITSCHRSHHVTCVL